MHCAHVLSFTKHDWELLLQHPVCMQSLSLSEHTAEVTPARPITLGLLLATVGELL